MTGWCSGTLPCYTFFMNPEYQLSYCVYVQLSRKDDNFYVGYTTDLPRRLDEHFQGRNTSTASRRPFILVHCEYYLAKKDAERRETYLKTAKARRAPCPQRGVGLWCLGRRVLRLMLQDSLRAAKS